MKFIVLSLFVIQLSLADSLQEKLDARKTGMSKSRTPEMEKVFSDFAKANKSLANSGILEKAIKQGVKVPSFKINGKDISSFYKDSLLVLKFYRGHWCPYCMIELKEYETFKSKIEEKGAKIIALVPDTEEYIAKTKRKFSLSFPIYRDKNNQIAKKMGVAFTVKPTVVNHYKGFNIDLVKSQNNTNNELPLPGTYIIDKDGMIKYAFIDTDYTKRADPRDILKELSKL